MAKPIDLGSARNEVRGSDIADIMDSWMSSGSVANHTGPRILESPLKHCDPAQRATTRQPGATPQVLSIAMRFALEGLHQTALWNPFRVRVRMVREPGAAFIRIRRFSCPRLISASLSGSITASIKYNSFVVRARPRNKSRNFSNSKSARRRRSERLQKRASIFEFRFDELQRQFLELKKRLSDTSCELENAKAELTFRSSIEQSDSDPLIDQKRPMPGFQFYLTVIRGRKKTSSESILSLPGKSVRRCTFSVMETMWLSGINVRK